MKRFKGYLITAACLLVLSGISYCAQIFFFHRESDTFFYMLQDFAFVPIQVLLVSIIVAGLLNRREKQAKLSKMNMAIGTFFSEAGTELLRLFSAFDLNVAQIRSRLMVKGEWTDQEFAHGRYISQNVYVFDRYRHSRSGGAESIVLLHKRGFLLSLLENPNLLEHESFTDLLFAVFHLTEELAVRKSVAALARRTTSHVANDLKRVYVLLLTEWIAYVRHLKASIIRISSPW